MSYVSIPRFSILCAAIATALATGPALAAKGGTPGAPTDGEESGNNLSTPVIWSDDVTKALRVYNNDPMATLFTGLTSACTDIPGVVCYQQQDPNNIWQAESYNAVTGFSSYDDDIVEGPDDIGITMPFMVDEIDWGDNLEARDWNVNSIVRVETVLWQLLGGDGNHNLPNMTGYEMSYLFGQGPSEMWGTTTDTYSSTEATVYSGCARLTIQKIAELADYDPENPPALTWDREDTLWEDSESDAFPTFFNGAVWEAGDGPGFYSAEINIPGRVIYGFNWNVRKLGDGDGVYRLTFSLDGTFEDTLEEPAQQCGTEAVPIMLNTWLDEASIRLPVEEVEAEDEGGDTGGGTAVVDAGNNLTYIDVRILPRKGGGGTGGGGGGGGQGNGNGQGNGGPKR